MGNPPLPQPGLLAQVINKEAVAPLTHFEMQSREE
jgi:hypothetical protein